MIRFDVTAFDWPLVAMAAPRFARAQTVLGRLGVALCSPTHVRERRVGRKRCVRRDRVQSLPGYCFVGVPRDRPAPAWRALIETGYARAIVLRVGPDGLSPLLAAPGVVAAAAGWAPPAAGGVDAAALARARGFGLGDVVELTAAALNGAFEGVEASVAALVGAEASVAIGMLGGERIVRVPIDALRPGRAAARPAPLDDSAAASHGRGSATGVR